MRSLLVLKIIMWVLNLIAARGESAPAREERAEHERFKKLTSKKKLSEDEFNTVAALAWGVIERVSRPEGSSPTG